MKKQISVLNSVWFWVVLTTLISLILILLRVLPLGGPFIFSDEYLYGAWASALFHGTAGVPPLDIALGNWLYMRVYSSVFIGSGSFLINARILNAIFSALGAGALIWALRVVEPTRKQLLPAVLASAFAVGLLGTYAGYFIPEAPYFAATCVWLLCVACYTAHKQVSLAIVTGIIGGVVAMVKGHGFLLLPATIFVFIFAGINARENWRKTSGNTLLLIIAWLLCSAVIGLTLRNNHDLNPLGGRYGYTASGILDHLESYVNKAFVVLFLRYLATLIIILGLPFLMCVWLALLAVFRPKKSDYKPTLLFSALLLCCATAGFLLVSSVFTVAAVTPGSVTYEPYHNLGRLDGGRYYEDFALLAACVGVMGSRTILARWSGRARLTTFALFCVLLVGCWWVLRGVGWQNPNDFAIAYGFFSSANGRYFALFLAAVGAAFALISPKRAPVVLACTLVVWLAFDTFRTEQFRWPVQEQAAGRVAAVVAATGNRSTTVEIVGPGATVGVYRAAFHLLRSETRFALGGAAGTCGVTNRAPDWVITVNGSRDPCGYSERIRIGNAAAAERASPARAIISSNSGTHYHASLALAAPASITANGKSLQVIVEVTNDGLATFGSATTPNPVNIGAHTLNAAGDIVVNDFARGHLPQIAPGKTTKASILLPVAGTLGHRVELLPVQENVAWFNQWGTKPLIVGPFEACPSSSTIKVCNASGEPLPKADTVE